MKNPIALVFLSLLIALSSSCGSSSPDCTPDAHTTCLEGVTYSVDSCGVRGDSIETCACGCSPNATVCRSECPCAPECTGKTCGDDGCGGSCGTCDDGVACTTDACEPTSAVCLSTPDDANCDDENACTLDTCLVDTGCQTTPVADGTACPEGSLFTCQSGECICTPDCAGKECGDDGCGGQCGSGCPELPNVYCDETGTCTDDCADRQCGLSPVLSYDCGTCGSDRDCDPAGSCQCSFDPCTGDCCTADQVCHADACCTPACAGKLCGPDGCGGECGICQTPDTCDPTGHCVADPWAGITIQTAIAPDEYQVQVTFSADPGDQEAGPVGIYGLDSPVGSLAIQGVSYDPSSRTATLTTPRQKLGITYTLRVDNGGFGLSADFLSADTAQLWVTDFYDPNYGQYEITAYRAGVGTTSVVYIEQGFSAPDVQHTMDEFDQQVYPVLTAAYTAAPDFDGNGKILLLGQGDAGFAGGYFSGTNQYPDSQTWSWWGIHSNEMDMVTMNMQMGSFMVEDVVAHEFGHLLYHERHGFTNPYWAYHDEGLAECARHVVYGHNDYAVSYYQWDPEGKIGQGISLAEWGYAEYEFYAMAYLFWTYVASRHDGVPTYGQVFDLPTGDPDEINTWLLAELGQDFPSVLLDNQLANWIQAPSGPYGYDGMLAFAPHSVPSVPAGTSTVGLKPFSAVFFLPQQDQVDYPGTEGPNIVYVGIDQADAVDLLAPFSVSNGALLVFNQSMNHTNFPAEHSGPDLPSGRHASEPRGEVLPPPPAAWWNPPPIRPDNRADLDAWRSKVLERIERDGWPRWRSIPSPPR